MKTLLNSLMVCFLLSLATTSNTFANNYGLNGLWTDASGRTFTIRMTLEGLNIEYTTGFGAEGREERFRRDNDGTFVRQSEVWLGTYQGDIVTPDRFASVRIIPSGDQLRRYQNNRITTLQRVNQQPASNSQPAFNSAPVPQVPQPVYNNGPQYGWGGYGGFR